MTQAKRKMVLKIAEPNFRDWKKLVRRWCMLSEKFTINLLEAYAPYPYKGLKILSLMHVVAALKSK